MNFRPVFLLSVFTFLICAPFAQAEDDPAPPPAPAKPQEVEGVLDALNTEAVTAAMGKIATVKGTVTEIFWVRDSVLLITYQEAKDGFVAVSFKKHREALDAGFDGDITTALKGKTIQVRGKVVEYQYRPQIVVETADQIEILD